MDTFTRQKRRWFKDEQPLKQIPPWKTGQEPAKTGQHLCGRCERLKLQEHLERPWEVWDVEAGEGFREAVIDEQSLLESCPLCAQLRALLEAAEPTQPGAPHGQTRSLSLVCRRVISSEWSMIEFSVTRSGSNREWLLFPTQALPAFSYYSGALSCMNMDNTFHEFSVDQERMPNTLDFPSIRGWIKSCKSHHGGSCEDKTHTGVGPKILIDCRERQLCSNVGSPYACLSYVWGALEVPIHRLSGDVLPEVLPQTVSDAMAVTLRIGLRYLWIDRYCIDQSDAEAKHDAILNMDIIYRGAELTIIAASGTGPDHGLPGVSKARAPRPILTIGSHTLVATEHPRREIEFSKWSTRGWTYQEVLLSSRRLVFTDTQVYFQCKSSYTLEGWGRPQEALSRNSRLMLAAFPEISGISRVSSVYSRLEEYYRRELSYQSDIIDAFTGIFRALQSLQQHGSGPRANHFYGIPIIYNRPQDGSNKGILINAEFSFGLGLAWKVHHQSFNFARFNRLGQPIMSGDQTLYRLPVPQNPFPSWTWAAFKASQPHSDPGQLSFPFQRVPGDEGKDDDYLEVNIFHNSGVKMSLRQYLLKGEDYINFRPVMEITALVISGWLTLDRHGTIGYSAFPGYVLHLHDPPESIENKLMAICVGSAGRDNTADYPVVIIVEEVETEPGAIPEYRHIGICPWSKGFIGKAARPSTTSLEVMSKGSPWHRQTLRLV